MPACNRRSIVILASLTSILLTCSPAAFAQGAMEAQAIAGEPFGVGAITLNLPAEMLPEPLGLDGVGISEKSGRVFYPALRTPALANAFKEFLAEDSPLINGGPVRQEVGGILRGILNRPPRTTLYFLFRGAEPLDLTIQARKPIPLIIQPRNNPAALRRLLQAWWRDYAAPRRLLQQKPDFPPQVETYLVNTLARRLNLVLPREKREESGYRKFERELGALAGSEGIRTAIEQDRDLSLTNAALPADQPLPIPPDIAPLTFPETPPADAKPSQEAKIEPIARHVPAEFFYIRFGSFDNFLWFQDTLDTWGGDLQNLVAMRGLNDQKNQRIQNQLVLEQTQLSRVLGGTVISDVAMVGTDLLMQDGAAIGFLFEARNGLLLGSSLTAPRAARVQQGKAKEESVKIEGQNVSCLSSPDGSIRSYYVVSGDYHLVTSSPALVARFLKAAKGEGSLGNSPEFRHARTVLPIDRNDAVFVYFSDAFFRNFTSPAYRIESLRRLEAATDIEIVQLAKLNAATEGKPGGTIEELISGGFLPPGFGPRPDGSHAVIGKGEVYDSVRGRRGSFVPVPDVPVQQVSQAEAGSYARFVAYAQENWGRVEPILVGLQRKSLPGKREQVVIDARMTPLQRKRTEMLAKIVGPIAKDQLAEVPGNMGTFEASLPNQRMFGGLRDVAPPNELIDGRFMPWLKLRNAIVAYLGYQGDAGFLRLLELMFAGPPDANGFQRSVIGLWRLQYGSFVLFSFQPEVSAAVASRLRFEPAKQPAQLRLHVNDITGARIAPFLNNWGYARTRETALGNIRLMHSLNQQLHVPVKDCREAAEFLLAAKLVCPLGGQYVLRDVPAGESYWTSTRLEEFQPQGGFVPEAPQGYVAPPLNWFRGLDLHAALVDTLLAAHVEVVMQLPGK
ncbi:MAG: hypothetical protein ACLP9L_40255 [Thermoguttaceae bacterium]